MELAYRLVPISQGPKNSGILGPNPLPLPHIIYMQNYACIQNIMHGAV
jgi:hypothetical protein